MVTCLRPSNKARQHKLGNTRHKLTVYDMYVHVHVHIHIHIIHAHVFYRYFLDGSKQHTCMKWAFSISQCFFGIIVAVWSLGQHGPLQDSDFALQLLWLCGIVAYAMYKYNKDPLSTIPLSATSLSHLMHTHILLFMWVALGLLQVSGVNLGGWAVFCWVANEYIMHSR